MPEVQTDIMDYNTEKVAEQYREAKQQPSRLLMETYSFQKLVGTCMAIVS